MFISVIGDKQRHWPYTKLNGKRGASNIKF